jgi:HlyD family secretion protein
MKRKKWLIPVLIVAVIIILVLVFFIFRGNGNHKISYKTEALKRGDIEAIVSTTGTVNPVTVVEVGSQVSGTISRMYVDYNSPVKEGQVVAEIDPSQIMTRIKQNEANYESARASLEKAKVSLQNSQRQYERALELFKKELISFEEKESSEAQYLTARAEVQASDARLLQARSQLDSSKVDLDYTVIKSPIDGVVISRNVNVGQTVAASFQAPVLFEIANDLSKMQVECSIDEADIGKIKEGQDVRFTVDAFPEEKFTGQVTQVRYSPEVIQNVVTYTTIVAVDNPHLKLRPGMTATASIVAGKADNVLSVPNAALRFTPQLSPEEMGKIMSRLREEMMKRRGGREPGARSGQRPGFANMPRVWVLDEKGQISPFFISTGVTDDSYTEVVRSRLKEGQLVITGISSGENSRGGSNMDQMRRAMRMFRR